MNMWTCCATDHSKGCPFREIGGYKPYNRMPNTSETWQKFQHDFLLAKQRLGYSVEKCGPVADK